MNKLLLKYNYPKYTADITVMNFRPKKLLLILELNETLLYLKNDRSKVKDFAEEQMKLQYDDKFGNHSVIYRKGKL